MSQIPPYPSQGADPATPSGGFPPVIYWKKVVLENYANFRGRAGRPEFWWFALASFVVEFVLGILAGVSRFFWVFYALYALGVLIPSLAVGIRRLHDTSRSGWWILISLVPFVGTIILIVFLALPPTPNANQYGPPVDTRMA